MFFTFWGLNLLRKAEKVQTKDKKSTLPAMFGKMMPKGTGHLGLSKMNFAGAGAPMMKKVMKDAGAMSLEELVASAREQGVKFIACTLSMDILGFKEKDSSTAWSLPASPLTWVRPTRPTSISSSSGGRQPWVP